MPPGAAGVPELIVGFGSFVFAEGTLLRLSP